ncbi:NAD(P)(+)--arginine ADP-ribosyltransferase 1-like [Periophthalmus magnuspinnatus]|uniref:NAD(P)(+)--arginine ADP-ribosyltransferase 1-like n=1 Tax=Periophthalmus magnuspinnatus TaxID=409849 RepID=UPI00145AFAFE|nr:NAD(P)(+)--arginine ADP-ribosyltransferase 1-like [Periophthalmus magnuspinnatus]
MWSVWAALLLSHTALMGSAMEPAQPHVLALDMALDSVDDMYNGCEKEMEAKVRKEYLPLEKNIIQNNFPAAWSVAENYYNKIWKKRGKKRPSTSLSKEQIMSIYMYSLEVPNVYIDFNNAVRTQGPVYKNSFKYHALHYFLTTAIQKLNARRVGAERCVTVYRRVNAYFTRDCLNKLVRFGSFTSASLGSYPNPARFGDKSCFEITTCFGADVSLFSKVGEAEREVLAPPYEVFKVTQIRKRSENSDLPCEFVYTLKSSDVLSRLNCNSI